MTHPLTRRNVSALARLDLAGLSHAQRVDAIARALGYATGAALMGTLKATEGAAPTEASKPLRLVLACGSEMCSAISDGFLDRELSDVDGDISVKEFATQVELDAYAKGVEDAEGWMDAVIHISEDDEPDHPYFKALDATPDLDFAKWFDDDRARAAEEEKDYFVLAEYKDKAEGEINESLAAANGKVVGYQILDPETDTYWKDRPSFEILTHKTAIIELAEARRARGDHHKLQVVLKGSIEDPSFC